MGIELVININSSFGEKIEELIKEEVNQKTATLYAEIVEASPVGKSKKGYTGGRLRKGWQMTPAEVKADKVVACVYNNVHYTGHVNYGHRTRLGTGKKKSKAYGKKYVDGQFFIEKALKKADLE